MKYKTIPDSYGYQDIITKEAGEFINSYGSPAKIITPLKPVQGFKEDRQLNAYLEENRDKISHAKIFFGPFTGTNGQIIYIMEEE